MIDRLFTSALQSLRDFQDLLVPLAKAYIDFVMRVTKIIIFAFLFLAGLWVIMLLKELRKKSDSSTKSSKNPKSTKR